MANEKSIVEDALLQMKNLEEAVAENAKGILASTMKEEIGELVKESLSEAEEDDEEEIETEVEEDSEDDEETDDVEDVEDSEEEDTTSASDDEMSYMSTDTDNSVSDEEEPIDLTHEKSDEVMKVFELLGPNDKIIVKKDDAGNINIKDTESDREFMIVGESETDDSEFMEEEENYEDMNSMNDEYNTDMNEDEENIDDIISSVFDDEESEENEEGNEEESEEDEYEVEFNDLGEDDSEDMSTDMGSETNEIMYEIEIDEEDDEFYSDEEGDEEDEFYGDEEEEDEEYEEDEETYLGESKKMSTKPKGVGMGKAKFSYKDKPNMSGGFKTVSKKSDKTMGTGNAKSVKIYKDKTNMDGKNKMVKGSKKMETKEASRTLGVGRSHGRRGLPKPKTYSRHVSLKESNNQELDVLRQKNDEYRKALNVFRNKLNEVAVFNSNLAYATRLFTEHSTSKQEKINILRRFDSVESLKESKNLYKQIKDELGTSKTEQISESVERKIQNTPTTGSAANLIESKTYENPQFLRMKDLMSKIK